MDKRVYCKMLCYGLIEGLVVAMLLLAVVSQGEAKGRRKPTITGVININTATMEQLTLLPRIGPKIARRIIAYRQKQLFKHPHQIMKVRGVGRKTYQKMVTMITTSGQTQFRLVSKRQVARETAREQRTKKRARKP